MSACVDRRPKTHTDTCNTFLSAMFSYTGALFDAVSVVNTNMTSNLTVSPLLLEFLYVIGASGQNSRLLIIETLVGRLWMCDLVSNNDDKVSIRHGNSCKSYTIQAILRSINLLFFFCYQIGCLTPMLWMHLCELHTGRVANKRHRNAFRW